LLVEYAIRGALHIAAAEAVLATIGEEAAIEEICIINEDLAAEEDVIAVIAYNPAFVAFIDLGSVLVDVSAALGAEHELVAVGEILPILHVEAGAAIFAILEIITIAVLQIVPACGFHDHFSLYCAQTFLEGLVLSV
jgi:hypothetical protein